MDWTVRLSDAAIVCATLLGPILAVQAQKWLERGQDRRQSRLRVFKILMATRRTILSPTHVEALNIVPIEFYGRNRTLVAVTNAWKAYIDHLYKEIVDDRAWGEKRVELLNDLLVKMSTALGYNFNSVEISRELYSPKGHAAIESDQEIIRHGLARLFKGEISLPMDVRSFPTDPTFVQNQSDLQKRMIGWLGGAFSVKVDTTGDSQGARKT